MARLAETLIERIMQDISLVRLAESQGHQLKKRGKDYALNCPFHEDKTASLIITPKSNLWHCMGACNQGGSVIDWVMKSQGVSFRFACELLQKDLGLVLDSGTKATKQNTTIKLPLCGQTLAELLARDDIAHALLAGVQGSEVDVPITGSGSYVCVQLAGTGILSLAEV